MFINYVSPCLGVYPNTILSTLLDLQDKKFKPFSSIEISMFDGLHAKVFNLTTIEPRIYLTVDTVGEFINYEARNRAKFTAFLKECRKSKLFVEDYPVFKGEINDRYHTIVLSLPSYMEVPFQNFLQGEYSKMYTELEFKSIFETNKYAGYITDRPVSEIKAILMKTPEGLDLFAAKIKSEFGTDIDKEAYTPEYDLPVLLRENIINYEYLSPETLKVFKAKHKVL